MKAVLAGDQDRERAAGTLRDGYVRGRLTLDEFTERTARVVRARSQEELGVALSGLPRGILGVSGVDTRNLAADARFAAHAILRWAALVLFTGAYLAFSFGLLVVFALMLLLGGSSTTALVGFLVAWLLPTYLLVRLWKRRPSRPVLQRSR